MKDGKLLDQPSGFCAPSVDSSEMCSALSPKIPDQNSASTHSSPLGSPFKQTTSAEIVSESALGGAQVKMA